MEIVGYEVAEARIPESLDSGSVKGIYGQQNKWNYSIVPCINNYNNPMCKKEVISRLHNDNKASIKIFECLTGLKLPNGYKERVKYLESLTRNV